MRTEKIFHVLLALAILVVWGGSARAFLETGTLLTNAASATYTGGNQGTSVTYSATAKILIANPAMFLWKAATPTVVGTSGGLTTYVICFSNGGANTAWNVTITDRLPNNTFWDAINSSWVSGSTLTTTHNLSDPPVNPWVANEPPAGQGSTNTTPVFLRWVAGSVGVGRSGCITFTLSVG